MGLIARAGLGKRTPNPPHRNPSWVIRSEKKRKKTESLTWPDGSGIAEGKEGGVAVFFKGGEKTNWGPYQRRPKNANNLGRIHRRNESGSTRVLKKHGVLRSKGRRGGTRQV